MHYQFLIEDKSGEALIDTLMKKIISERITVTYDCKSFKGIGGFTKKNTVKETKTGKLLNDLATYLRGFNRSLSYIDAVIIVVLDNDKRDTSSFEEELEHVAALNMITLDHVFCIAVEEMEAWLLGDEEALVMAYPEAKMQPLHSYVQDSICGTWEVLAEVVYPGGIAKLRKECPSYLEVGRCKIEWSSRIGRYMNVETNKSPSFKRFVEEIYKRLPVS